MLTKNENKLMEAVDENDLNKVLDLLQSGVNPNAYDYLYFAIDDEYFDIAKLLLDFGANPDQYQEEEFLGPLYDVLCWEKPDLSLVQLLLEKGADPNKVDEGTIAVYNFMRSNNQIVIKLLLEFGSKAYINAKRGMCNCSILEASIYIAKDLKMVKLILDNGADPSIPDEYGDSMISLLEMHKEEYSKDDYNEAKRILNADNPPYLKLGKNQEDKYIIYNNQDCKPWLLADIGKHEDKKYLYHNFEIAYFLLWSARNDFLLDGVNKLVLVAESDIEGVTQNNIIEIMKNTIGERLTTEYFKEEYKEFVVGYLTVTNWWYSYHYDLIDIFPEKNNFANIPDENSSYKLISKLLSKRFEQFQSRQYFNSNQKLLIAKIASE